jgi:predicted dehydrogenase
MSDRTAFCWLHPTQAPLLRAACEKASLRLVAAGSGVAGQSGTVADALGAAESIDDLRAGLGQAECDLVILASLTGLDEEAAEQLRILAKAGTKILSMEPLPGSLRDATAHADRSAVELVPMMRRSPGFRAAELMLPTFGEVRCVNVSFRAGPGEGSLSARLYSGLDVIYRLCGQPELIDAAMAGTPGGALPEKLAGIDGHLTANLRFPENRAACLAISDLAGKWSRGVTVLGEGGCLRIDDRSAEWIGPKGEMLDEATTPGIECLSDLIADHIDRALDHKAALDPPTNHTTILAMCEAAVLSARTAQSESPRKLLHLAGVK